jgi:hypoxanthine phosphoribosyltransferase
MESPEVLQWLDERNMQEVKGKRVLIVDEVDDTRLTLE